MNLTFDLYVGGGVSLVSFTHSFNFCYEIDLNWEYFFEGEI